MMTEIPEETDEMNDDEVPLFFEELETEGDGHIRPAAGTVVHVTWQCHLGEGWLQQPKAKEIFLRLLRRYCRICRYGLLHYSIMDTHPHLILKTQEDAEPLDKMIGTLKAQFTRKYKSAMREAHQSEFSFGGLAENGTLWTRSFFSREVLSNLYLLNCVFYVEANQLKAMHPDKIEEILYDLIEKPEVPPEFEDLDADCPLVLQPGYADLVERARDWSWHSARYYLDESHGDDPYLTDGTDAVWASAEEVERYWETSLANLPKGWRKVYFGQRHRILKPTPDHRRKLPVCPVFSNLGANHLQRVRRFAVGLMDSVWRGWSRIAEDTPRPNERLPILAGLDVFEVPLLI
jgi:REP element-mobilizing transposase RayT